MPLTYCAIDTKSDAVADSGLVSPSEHSRCVFSLATCRDKTNTAPEFSWFGENARVVTAMGALRLGDVWEGDHVQTLDGGAQPVVRIRRCVGSGQGDTAPVLFAPGAIGNHSPLKLSQMHRVMISSPMAELMFGACEVLVPAKALVNDEDVCLIPCAQITYVQLELARHHVLIVEGAYCESFLPGDVAQSGIDPGPRAIRPTRPARLMLGHDEALALIAAHSQNFTRQQV